MQTSRERPASTAVVGSTLERLVAKFRQWMDEER
jgi:hypothetical protein